MRQAARIAAAALFAAALYAAVAGAARAQDGVHARFERGDSTVALGVTFFDRIIYMPVRINGAGPFSFVLDTGAGGISAVDQSVADSLGMQSTRLGAGGGAGEDTVTFTSTEPAAFSVEGLSFGTQAALGLPLHRIDAQWGKRKDGLFGGDLLSALVTRIDYEKKTVTFHDARSYEYRGPGERIPMQVVQNFLFVEGQVFLYGSDKPIDALFLVDTGVRMTVFNSPYSAEHSLPAQSPTRLQGVTGCGIGGVSKGFVGRVRSIGLGSIVFENPAVTFSTDSAGALADTNFAGIIGADFLERFTAVFDYSRSSMFLEKNRAFGAPFEWDMSGIRFALNGKRFEAPVVFWVFDGSPAAEAGVKVGDIVTAIDGRPAASFTMESLRTYMQREGAVVRLDLERGAEKKSVDLRLRKLI
jgi:hypothetical protein